MNFYIHKIQLWFTREDADHVTYVTIQRKGMAGYQASNKA